MTALRFASEEALRIALTSSLLPEAQARLPVLWCRSDAGEVIVQSVHTLTDDTVQRLVAAGASPASPIEEGTAAQNWAAVIQPARHSGIPPLGHVLFQVPKSESALSLAGEMLRLGCDRQTYCFLPDCVLIKVIEPPLYTALRAIEHTDGARAFVSVHGGTWIEAGLHHPLAHRTSAPDGALLLIEESGTWRSVPDGPWTDIYSLLTLQLPDHAQPIDAIAPTQQLTVTLHLGRSPTIDVPSLWVLRNDAIARMEDLVANLPEELLHRILFAVGGPAEEPIVILRSRMGREGPVKLALDAEAYTTLQQINNLFRPVDRLLEPPLRRDKVRELVAPDATEVAWLAPVADRFRVERIREDAFRPLSAWVDYLVSKDAEALESWARGATFQFESFVSTGGEWSEGPPPPPQEQTPIAAAPPRSKPAARKTRRPRPAPVVEPEPVVTESQPLLEYQPSELEERLTTVEEQFLAMDAAADAPDRQVLWHEMAALNSALLRSRDAGRCWTRALWELPPDAAAAPASQWARSEVAQRGTHDLGEGLSRLLSQDSASRDDLRAMVSLVVCAATGGDVPGLADHLHNVAVWLDQNAAELDVRAFWLGRWGLARLVGGDSLGLSRARDAVLLRLQNGLSVERDVPNFLRFLGRGSAGDSTTVAALAAQLEQLWTRFDTTERRRSVMEAPNTLSRAYVQFVFAYGFARLGRTERVRAFEAEARSALDQTDEIHRILTTTFSARIAQALDGRPPETPLPPEVAGALNELSLFVRYKVDRLRQACRILETQERLDPTTAFQLGEQDPRGPEFLALRGMTDPGELTSAVEQILRTAARSDVETRIRLYDGAMDFFPQLPASRVVPWLERLIDHLSDIPSGPRAMLYEEALVLAGFFGRTRLVRTLVGALRSLLMELASDEATEVASTISKSLRGLRRFGFRAEAAGLLETMNEIIRGEGADALVARLNTSAGLAFLGDLAAAQPVFEQAQTRLRGSLLVTERLRISRALAEALAQTPQEHAISGLTLLSEQLPEITDSLATNTHFCLSVVQFMECVVLGYASEHLVLGERGRRWLDEDEYLVRRRIHRDLADPQTPSPTEGAT